MKFLSALLILVIPLVASGQNILVPAEDTSVINTTYITGTGIGADQLWWGGIDSLMSDIAYFSVKHDTAKEYITKIYEKCDTAWTKEWKPWVVKGGEQYFRRMTKIDSVYCHIDTLWADKKLIYLTPDEMEDLRWLLDSQMDTVWAHPVDLTD